jgi:cytoskeletal protein CcmA (bactofilin family)
MKRFKAMSWATLLILTVSSTSFAGTIVGARTNRTGTIVGARSGNIAGTRSGNIAGTRTGNVDASLLRQEETGIKTDLSSLISDNIDSLLRLFLTRSLF